MNGRWPRQYWAACSVSGSRCRSGCCATSRRCCTPPGTGRNRDLSGQRLAPRPQLPRHRVHSGRVELRQIHRPHVGAPGTQQPFKAQPRSPVPTQVHGAHPPHLSSKPSRHADLLLRPRPAGIRDRPHRPMTRRSPMTEIQRRYRGRLRTARTRPRLPADHPRRADQPRRRTVRRLHPPPEPGHHRPAPRLPSCYNRAGSSDCSGVTTCPGEGHT